MLHQTKSYFRNSSKNESCRCLSSERTKSKLAVVGMLSLSFLAANSLLQAEEPNQVQRSTSALKQNREQNPKVVDNRVRPVSDVVTEVANPKLAKMLKQLEKCQEEVNKLQDYTADFEKYELVDRTGPVRQQMKIKHRPNPFSVHLQFLSGSPQADQVLYSQGFNQDQIQVKLTGALSLLTSSVSLPPRDPKAMEYSRHPITEIGLKGLLEGIVTMWKDDLKYADLEVYFYKDAKLNQSSTATYYAFKTVHPRPRNIPRFQESTLWIDKKTLLPVQLVNKGFNPNGGEAVLVEMYKYTNLKTNVGLQNADFDPRRYNF
ncbi:hypothetical protein Pla110_12550 [Polystyrenella longa]|uniref:Uncharacterized protein n=1 Tax=Polystyrenella longa TaxID=2528007 RepID=A0A518CK40_9PLAN|nr:DUF1571 domain-containing protein [Polystyrenella longa]QDU79544.1 hypothetical protein Pla110_12550 [Polystyrenella longa]